MSAFLGVDVGTASVRVGLVTDRGQVLHTHVTSIEINNPAPDYFEQSSEGIWQAICNSVKHVMQKNLEPKLAIKGIGFDATCSLVVFGSDLRWDVIMWMDHRAKAETAFINSLHHPVLDYVGGKVSLEMEMPKLLWLKRNRPEIFAKATAFFDLADFLAFKATGNSQVRSLCTLVCKWNYRAKEGWDAGFLAQIGLDDLNEKIGLSVALPGAKIGCLSPEAALELGLNGENVQVAAGLIDAHAGVLGLLASEQCVKASFEETLCLIVGTSACHMVLSKEEIKINGIWGPYYSAILNDFYLFEGGQSSVGSLLDHLITSHPAFPSRPTNIYAHLEEICAKMKSGLPSIHHLTKDLHVVPDFHGNRSPFADPDMKGSMVGLVLDKSESNLALTYLATVQALAYGTKLIVDHLIAGGLTRIKQIAICGGLSKSDFFIQTISDVLNVPVIKPLETESVLLGSAVLASAAANGQSLEDSLRAMRGPGKAFLPCLADLEFHLKKYRVFKKMIDDQLAYREIMNK